MSQLFHHAISAEVARDRRSERFAEAEAFRRIQHVHRERRSRWFARRARARSRPAIEAQPSAVA